MGWFRRDGEIDDELRRHLEMQIEANERAGMSPEDARRAAHRSFGSAISVAEDCREARGYATIDTTLQDLRYGVRTLTGQPAFTLAAVLTLALGIGANTAIFSVVNGVLLRPLAFEAPDRLVMIWETDRIRGTGQEAVSAPDYLDIRSQAKSYESLAVSQFANRTLSGHGEPLRLNAARVSAGYFGLLRVRPVYGLDFDTEHEQPGHDKVVLLSEGLWLRQFGGDRSVLGRTVVLDGVPHVVHGVMPAHAGLPGRPVDVWTPAAFDYLDRFRGRHNFRLYARLRPDVTLEQAQTEIAGIMQRLEKAYPDENEGRGAQVVPLHEQIVGNLRTALIMLLGATGLVLLIACVNVSGLLLGRAAARQREMGLRVALGASRARLIRQLLTEHLWLAAIGSAAGLALGWACMRLLTSFGPATIPRLADVRLDRDVLIVTVLVSLAAWLLFGIAPAIRASRADASLALHERGVLGATARQSVRQALVAGQIALATLLAVGACLLIRSFSALTQVDPGFDPARLLTLSVELPPARYPAPKTWPILKWPEVASFQDRLLQEMKSVPGVESVSLCLNHPLDPAWTTRVTVVGRPAPPPGQQDEAGFRLIDDTYFATLRTPIMRGRAFTVDDDARRPLVAIVDEAFVRRHFPTEDPLGQSIAVFGAPRQIVGVSRDIRYSGLERLPRPTMHFPVRQNPFSTNTVLVRASGDPAALIATVRRAVSSADADLAVYDVAVLDEMLALSVADRRFSMILLAAFAALALGLAAVGNYGLVAYTVSQRTSEIGIRVALGARTSAVLALVAGEGIRSVAAGLLVGVVGALALSRILGTMLFGVGSRDVVAFLAAAGVLVLAAAAATFIPALRATRIDPSTALRCQ